MVPLRLRQLLPRIFLITSLVILGLVGIIQYQWFSQSAAVEIETTIHGVENQVRSTVLREFQRYAPLISELDGLKGGTADAGAELHRLLAAYGPQGTAPGLVAWAGWTDPDGKTYWRANGAGPFVRQALPNTSWTYEIRGQDAPEGLPRDNVFTLRLDGAQPQILLIGLDLDTFFQKYVQAGLQDSFPGAAVSWDEAELGPPPRGFDQKTYAFNPVTALISGASLPRTLTVGLPRLIDLGRGPAQHGGGFRVFSAWEVKLTLPADAPVLGVEGRLAASWLGGTLLLVVLAAAFVLVGRQAAKITALRRQEREFVASVSHELRTPLTVIRSAADNFARGIVPAERQKRYGELILDQSVRLGRMIEEMLAFAQTEAGHGPKVSALLVFESWLAELRPGLDALAATRHSLLHWDVAGVPAEGRTDPDVARLILENLVVNALNHAYPTVSEADPATRPVRITLKYLVPGRLQITVDDEGRGIAPKEARHVFEPFYRDQVSRDTQEKGSGLGLFLAQRQARRAGGDLKLESPWRRPDGTRRSGCRFTATLPLQTEALDGR